MPYPQAGVQEGRWLWLAPVGYLNQKTKTYTELVVDPQKAPLVKQAFELTASRSYTLEEILHRINLLGLTGKHGRPMTKQTLSRMLRNQIYAGWVVSGENRVRGLHEPLVSQELFNDIQDALDGKTTAPVVHKKLNEDFPLKGFVLCATCGKKLTAGFVKGRKEKYPRYWCWNPKCEDRVSDSRELLENQFLGILRMMEPTQALLDDLPRIAKEQFKSRLERVKSDRKSLSERLAQSKTLNQTIFLKKVKGELSAEEYNTAKEMVVQQMDEVKNQQEQLNAEFRTVEQLLEDFRNEFV